MHCAHCLLAGTASNGGGKSVKFKANQGPNVMGCALACIVHIVCLLGTHRQSGGAAARAETCTDHCITLTVSNATPVLRCATQALLPVPAPLVKQLPLPLCTSSL